MPFIEVSIDDKPIDPNFRAMSDLAYTAGFTGSSASYVRAGYSAGARNASTGLAVTITGPLKHDVVELACRLFALLTDDPDTAQHVRGDRQCDDCHHSFGYHDPEVEH